MEKRRATEAMEDWRTMEKWRAAEAMEELRTMEKRRATEAMEERRTMEKRRATEAMEEAMKRTKRFHSFVTGGAAEDDQEADFKLPTDPWRSGARWRSKSHSL